MEQQKINSFLEMKNIAFIGVSSGGKKFSNDVYKIMKEKGYNLYPVNEKANEIAGERCYRSISEIDKPLDAAVVFVKKSNSMKTVQEIIDKKIKNIWFGQGSETNEAVELCNRNGINTIDKHCLLMFLEPKKFPHNFHSFILKLFGKYPTGS